MAKPANELPHLKANTAASCPNTKKEIAEYLSLECGCRVAQRALTFVRTAKIGRTKYWLWRYETKEGEAGWALVHTHWLLGILPVPCTATWGERQWAPEELLLKYHWVNVLRKPLDEFRH